MVAKIEQKEPLYTVRPRSAVSYTDYSSVSYERGPKSRMRLLPLDSSEVHKGKIKDEVFNSILSGNADNDPKGWGNFMLTDVSCNMSEKVQIIEVFGDTHVTYYFGSNPTTFSLTGLLFDDIDNGWFTDFIEVYEGLIRGTQLAKQSMLLEVTLPNMKIIGSISSFSYNQTSGRDTDIPFSLQLLAKMVIPLRSNIPEVNPSSINKLLQLTSGSKNNFLSSQGMNVLKSAANLQKLVQNPYSTMSDLTSTIAGLGNAYNNGVSTGFGLASQLNGVGGMHTTGGPIGNALFSSNSGLSGGSGTPYIDQLGGTEDSGGQLTGGTSLGPYSLMSSGKPTSASMSALANNSIIGGISSTLTGIKSSMFSPMFGFLSQITNVVKSVTGDISKFISQFTAPTNFILREIQNLSGEAMKIVNLITSSVSSIISMPLHTLNEITKTINSLRRTAGAISKLPSTLSQIVSSLFNSGRLKRSSCVLKSGKGKNKNVPMLLNSRPKVVATSYMKLPSSIRMLT